MRSRADAGKYIPGVMKDRQGLVSGAIVPSNIQRCSTHKLLGRQSATGVERFHDAFLMFGNARPSLSPLPCGWNLREVNPELPNSRKVFVKNSYEKGGVLSMLLSHLLPGKTNVSVSIIAFRSGDRSIHPFTHFNSTTNQGARSGHRVFGLGCVGPD